ncbi:hypothetical protein BpHYR1_013693 [Brachionus plicatilis]|uniref:Uncharacterized protein n=1 Tax=Brachionus plicatilis TaxID=10195 RepID=A0A3M7RU64_BRAPC|nr:hypothetical protein BpHYR1_013693 [Brachionus plicatilis]
MIVNDALAMPEALNNCVLNENKRKFSTKYSKYFKLLKLLFNLLEELRYFVKSNTDSEELEYLLMIKNIVWKYPGSSEWNLTLNQHISILFRFVSDGKMFRFIKLVYSE